MLTICTSKITIDPQKTNRYNSSLFIYDGTMKRRIENGLDAVEVEALFERGKTAEALNALMREEFLTDDSTLKFLLSHTEVLKKVLSNAHLTKKLFQFLDADQQIQLIESLISEATFNPFDCAFNVLQIAIEQPNINLMHFLLKQSIIIEHLIQNPEPLLAIGTNDTAKIMVLMNAKINSALFQENPSAQSLLQQCAVIAHLNYWSNPHDWQMLIKEENVPQREDFSNASMEFFIVHLKDYPNYYQKLLCEQEPSVFVEKILSNIFENNRFDELNERVKFPISKSWSDEIVNRLIMLPSDLLPHLISASHAALFAFINNLNFNEHPPSFSKFTRLCAKHIYICQTLHKTHDPRLGFPFLELKDFSADEQKELLSHLLNEPEFNASIHPESFITAAIAINNVPLFLHTVSIPSIFQTLRHDRSPLTYALKNASTKQVYLQHFLNMHWEDCDILFFSCKTMSDSSSTKDIHAFLEWIKTHPTFIELKKGKNFSNLLSHVCSGTPEFLKTMLVSWQLSNYNWEGIFKIAVRIGLKETVERYLKVKSKKLTLKMTVEALETSKNIGSWEIFSLILNNDRAQAKIKKTTLALNYNELRSLLSSDLTLPSIKQLIDNFEFIKKNLYEHLEVLVEENIYSLETHHYLIKLLDTPALLFNKKFHLACKLPISEYINFIRNVVPNNIDAKTLESTLTFENTQVLKYLLDCISFNVLESVEFFHKINLGTHFANWLIILEHPKINNLDNKVFILKALLTHCIKIKNEKLSLTFLDWINTATKNHQNPWKNDLPFIRKDIVFLAASCGSILISDSFSLQYSLDDKFHSILYLAKQENIYSLHILFSIWEKDSHFKEHFLTHAPNIIAALFEHTKLPEIYDFFLYKASHYQSQINIPLISNISFSPMFRSEYTTSILEPEFQPILDTFLKYKNLIDWNGLAIAFKSLGNMKELNLEQLRNYGKIWNKLFTNGVNVKLAVYFKFFNLYCRATYGCKTKENAYNFLRILKYFMPNKYVLYNLLSSHRKTLVEAEDNRNTPAEYFANYLPLFTAILLPNSRDNFQAILYMIELAIKFGDDKTLENLLNQDLIKPIFLNVELNTYLLNLLLFESCKIDKKIYEKVLLVIAERMCIPKDIYFIKAQSVNNKDQNNPDGNKIVFYNKGIKYLEKDSRTFYRITLSQFPPNVFNAMQLKCTNSWQKADHSFIEIIRNAIQNKFVTLFDPKRYADYNKFIFTNFPTVHTMFKNQWTVHSLTMVKNFFQHAMENGFNVYENGKYAQIVPFVQGLIKEELFQIYRLIKPELTANSTVTLPNMTFFNHSNRTRLIENDLAETNTESPSRAESFQ